MKSVIITVKREHTSGRRESWHKSFNAIDRSQSGARSFVGGDYIKPIEQRLEVGSLVLHVVPTGSVKYTVEVAEILRVTADLTLEPLTKRFQWKEQFCSFQDLAETLLADNAKKVFEFPSLAEFSTEALEFELSNRRKLAV